MTYTLIFAVIFPGVVSYLVTDFSSKNKCEVAAIEWKSKVMVYQTPTQNKRIEWICVEK